MAHVAAWSILEKKHCDPVSKILYSRIVERLHSVESWTKIEMSASTSRRIVVDTVGTWFCSIRHIVKAYGLYKSGRNARAELNTCALSSLRLNNTRYLAADKCLNRRKRRGEGPTRNSVYFFPVGEMFRLIKTMLCHCFGSPSVLPDCLAFLPVFFPFANTTQPSLCHPSRVVPIHLEESPRHR